MGGTGELVEVLRNTPNLETEFIMTGSGLSVSYKRAS